MPISYPAYIYGESIYMLLGLKDSFFKFPRAYLHEILVRSGPVLVEEAVERLLVDPSLGKLNLHTSSSLNINKSSDRSMEM